MDIQLERDVATFHNRMPSSRPEPLYMRESRYSLPPSPRARSDASGLGPSLASRSRSDFKQNAYTTTQRENVQLVTDAEMAALSSSQTQACIRNRSKSITSDPFCAKPVYRADGSITPRGDFQQTYTTTQGDTALGVTAEQAAAYIRSQARACKANKAQSLTSQPLR